jgi:PAS domain-containing protein
LSQSLLVETGGPPALLESLLDLDQAVLDALPIGIYACDADGQILRVNRKAVELWGQAPRLLDPAQRFCGSFRVESLDGQFIPPDETPMARAWARPSPGPKPWSRIPTAAAGWPG